ncbi:hypothetical protein [Micromonospora sp. NPDC048830]|uniref:hypothetical protein n=1 Tax=Micromonospora sp. NPDC048830 TaxID=3364257 RepID=UPI003721B6BC
MLLGDAEPGVPYSMHGALGTSLRARRTRAAQAPAGNTAGQRHRAEDIQERHRVILTNPRCGGWQVWNKQRTDEVLLDVEDVAMDHTGLMRWSACDNWVISKQRAHIALISELAALFTAPCRDGGDDRGPDRTGDAVGGDVPALGAALAALARGRRSQAGGC